MQAQVNTGAVGFDIPGGRYDRFMGRYSALLAPLMVDAAEAVLGMTAVDVGCGPGAVTVELASRIGDAAVAGIEPSEPFVATCRERLPNSDIRQGFAEDLPWPDDAFDAALCCLVVGFMRDPQKAMDEMRRVTRPRGRVAACFWDVPRQEMLSLTAQAIRDVRPDMDPHPNELAGATEGDIARLMAGAGLEIRDQGEWTVVADYRDFDDFWDPITRSAGPIGDAIAALTSDELGRVRTLLAERMPDGQFSLSGTAWYAVGVVQG